MSLSKCSFSLVLIGVLALASCGVDDNPVTSVESSTQLLIQLEIQPTDALRTVETWNYWTVPVKVAFVVEIGGDHIDTTGGHGHVVSSNYPVIPLQKVTGTSEAQAVTELVGSIELAQMDIEFSIGDGAATWHLEHDGEMVEHHAESGSNQISVNIIETATGHHAHGGATVSHSHVTLIAAGTADTLEVHLVPVQAAHGMRYETNAELPYDSYDISLEIEPPHFLRDEDKMNTWTTDILTSFTGFNFDSQFTSGTVGIDTSVGAFDDSLIITLRAGSVQTYGAVGTGMVPQTGNETINFSLKLEDPTISTHGEPLFGSNVTVTILNLDANITTGATLNPIYGHQGFYFGENMHLGLEQHGVVDSGGHGH